MSPRYKMNEDERNLLLKKISKLPQLTTNVDSLRNVIVYGAPGTGKSFLIEKQRKRFFSNSEQFVRVTFHPNYTYSQFLGTYKPVPIYKEDSSTSTKYYHMDKTETKLQMEPLINYEFIAGPFLTMLVKALNHPERDYLILIEEINRANPASIFGDVFQLLDRNKDGESEYSITFNKDISNYLVNEGIKEKQIKLPSNLFIWATMNSADQGVAPMDTAFKRRWAFQYITLDDNASAVEMWEIRLNFLKSESKTIKWNKFREIINEKLIDLFDIAEDKLIGPFFLKEHELADGDVFKNKLLLYLKDDVLRHDSSNKFFKLRTFSRLSKAYDEGTEIFKFEIEG